MKNHEYMGINIGMTCELYRTYDPNESLYCRILDISDEWIIADRRGQDGEKFGVSLLRNDSIWKVRVNTISSKKIFSNANDLSFPKISGNHSLIDCINEFQKIFRYLALYCEQYDLDVCSIGSIENIKDGFIFINEYRPITMPEKNICIIRVDDISRVEAGGEYESRLMQYYNS